MRQKIFCIMLITVSILLGMKANAESVSLLKDLDVANGFMIQFDKDTFFYTVELDTDENLPQIIAVPQSEDCTVKIDGAEKKVFPGSEQTVTVSVHDTQGNFETYTLKVYAKGKKGGLEFLQCLNGTMSPQYRDSARNFYITLPNKYDAAKLKIRTVDKNAKTQIVGNENLEAGKRKRVMLNITDSDGVKYEYALYIYREAKVSSNINRSFLLSDIQINNGLVPIEFERTKGYYRIGVSQKVKKLDIKAFAEERNHIVEISGTDVVTNAEHNIMTITVSDPGDESLGKSIYVLDFFHNSYMTTPKYSRFQTIILVVATVFFTSIILAAIYVFLSRRKKKIGDKQSQQQIEKSKNIALESGDELSGRC